jgi:hypothetical protein
MGTDWVTSQVTNVEIVPGILYEAWTYNGRVPGPYMSRCRPAGSSSTSWTRSPSACTPHRHQPEAG